MFRALRFSAQMDFDVEEGTIAAIEKCAPLCASLSAERVRDETEKILLSDKPGVAGIAVVRGLFAHRLDSTGTGALNLETIAALPQIPELRWAAFAAVLAHTGYIASPPDFLRALRLDAKTVRSAGTGAAAAIEKAFPAKPAQIKKFLWQYGEEAAFCARPADQRCAEAMPPELRDVFESERVLASNRLAVGEKTSGTRLCRRAEPWRRSEKLLEHVLECPENNYRRYARGCLITKNIERRLR